MARLTALLGKPRTREVLLKSGRAVTICELSLADTWPYINGEKIDPDALIRASLIDDQGGALIPPDEGISMAAALELLPAILEFNSLEASTDDAGAEVAELDQDFPRAAPDG
jgi:hypothetical protein